MQYNAKAPYIVETHWQIEEVLDGDSIIICNRFTQMKKEIREKGICDAYDKISKKKQEKKEHDEKLAKELKEISLQR
jgi:micrococcal nuclease